MWYLRQPRRNEPEALPSRLPFRRFRLRQSRHLFHKVVVDTSEAMHLTVSQPGVGPSVPVYPVEFSWDLYRSARTPRFLDLCPGQNRLPCKTLFFHFNLDAM